MAPSAAAIVVDNASTDRSLARARQALSDRPGANVIANPRNLGFAAAVNQGFAAVEQNLRASSADCVLLLNPDVTLSTPLDPLERAALAHGLAAGQLTDSSGRPQTGFTIRRLPTAAALIFEMLGINRLWPGNPVNRRYRYLDRDLNQPGPVEQPAGAFLMIRRDVWRQLGGFDESFHPVWFEDVDFCRRALDAGFRIEYLPQVKALHTGGHSVSQITVGCRMGYWYASLLRYAAKHLPPPAYRAVWLAAILGAVPRMTVGMIQEKSLGPASAAWECFRQARTGQTQ